MRHEIQKIAESFYRTNTMSWARACDLAGLAVTVYEKEHRSPFRIVDQNPATRIQKESWR